MSFFENKHEKIKEGDLVMLFVSMNNIYPIRVVSKTVNNRGQYMENKFQTMYGALRLMDLVGREYGSKIHLPAGWAHILFPSCELWTKTLPHRTQIIYTADISLIIFGMDLAPGSIVIEAGTGSGSLSHGLIRTVYPTGHLYTFDFHEKRAEAARKEFQEHRLSEWVTVTHRDVIADGFGVEKLADGVFLDLPVPWEAVPYVVSSLKLGGKLCTFSPCIEQVQKTVEVLKKTECFFSVRTIECVQRPLCMQSRTILSLNFTPEKSEGTKMAPIKKDPCKFRTLAPPMQMQGHSGYLTFATLVTRQPRTSSVSATQAPASST